MDRQWQSSEAGGIDKTRDSNALEKSLSIKVDGIEKSFRKGLANRDQKETTNALLELDSTIWRAQKELEDEENISQAREILRDSIVLLGAQLGPSPQDFQAFVAPLVERMLQLRAQFREKEKWSEADSIRNILQQANILVEDTENGFRWRIIDEDV